MAATCMYCLDPMTGPANQLFVLDCTHTFHRICLARQTVHMGNENFSCPICRALYDTKSLRGLLKQEIQVISRGERMIKRAAKATNEEHAMQLAHQTALEFQRIENALEEDGMGAAEVNGEGEIVEDLRPGSGEGEIVTNARVPHWLFPYIPDWYHLPKWRGGNIKMRNSKRKPSTRRRKRSQSKLNYSKRRNIVLNNKR